MITSIDIKNELFTEDMKLGVYRFIKLTGSECWHMRGTVGAKLWVDKLSHIMGLNNNAKEKDKLKGQPSLIIIRKWIRPDEINKTIAILNSINKMGLPIKGWKAQSLGILRGWSHNEVSDIIYEIGSKDENGRDILRMWNVMFPIFLHAQRVGGLPFHTGLVEYDSKGVLLAAKGGGGKSTTCRRLPRPWRVLCDDELLILPDKQRQYVAHPFPTWSEYLMKRSESAWNIQNYVTLRAIFFLEKSETDEVVRIGQGQAAILIHQSALQVYPQSWNDLVTGEKKLLKKKLFDNACELAKTIPSFILRVSLTGRFWEKMEKVLSELSEDVG